MHALTTLLARHPRTLAVCTAALFLGCGSPDPNTPARPLPTHSGRAAELFDDSIEPAAVGLDYDRGYEPKSDAVLRERAQVSDGVVRVKVQTVTEKKDGPAVTFQLGLHTVESLGGRHPPPADFMVTVRRSSESHGIMRNFDARLVNRAFVAFVREFVLPDGDREYHFHLAPDSKDVRFAVVDALEGGNAKQ